MTNYGNTFNDIFTGLESLPLSTSLTGTVSGSHLSKAISGTNTIFKTEVGYTGVTDLSSPSSKQSLGYLWSQSDWEWRRVVDVYSDTLLYIE